MISDTREKMLTFISTHKNVRVPDLVVEFSLSRVAVHKQLKKLVHEGKIQKIGSAPRVAYAPIGKEMTIKEIQQKILPILKKAKVKKAAIFGSYARGEQTNQSDVDILVDLPSSATLFDLVGIQFDIEDMLKKKVDVVEYAGLKARIRDSILREQIRFL